MTNPRVGLITFGDHRDHEWTVVFRAMAEPRHQEAIETLQELPIELIFDTAVARTKDDIDRQADALQAAGVQVLIAHIPCWTSPNLVVRGVQKMSLPTILIGNKHPSTHSTVGLLGAGGTLSQIGFPHLRVREDFADGEAIANKLLPYCRAASVKSGLRGQMFGLFGGRSLGIDTGTFDPMQWRKLFGVDTEHIDQLEIIRRADEVPQEDVDKMVSWLTNAVKTVAYNEKLTPEKLAFQVRCYLATKLIIKDLGLDFVAIKCMPDLSTFYVPQCITAALLPGPYDADGVKDPMMMACEADGDAALTMEILKQISGGKPTLFMDVSYIDDETGTCYFPNCGAFCSWYAERSDNAEDNLKHVELRPAIRPGGGAITYFTTAPGPLTLARLYREDGDYCMGIITGETVDVSEQERQAFVDARGSHQLPTAYIKMDAEIDQLISGIGSNHIMAVAGIYADELVHFCEMMGVKSVMYNH